MTPFDFVLGEHGPRWLLGAVLLAALLTTVAAALEIALERAGGPDPAALPDWIAEHGPPLFVFAGAPALLLATLAALLLTLLLGGNPERAGLPLTTTLLVDVAVIVAMLGCGLGSPLTQHWGLAITAFGIGVGAIFPLLFVANALPFAADGGLEYPDRFIFALTVGLILFSLTLAGAALVALGAICVRIARALRDRRAARPVAQLHLLQRDPP